MIFFIVTLRSFIIGNHGFLIPGTIYIYIGSSASTLINLLNDKDSALHKYEIYLIIVGFIFLLTIIGILGLITRRELKKFIEEENNAS